MKDNGGLYLVLGAALLVALGLALWLIGAETLRTLAFILIGALAVAVILAAASLPIRSYRKRDFVGETHHYHDGTKTIVREVKVIDGRQPATTDIKLLQLPAPTQGGAFPELLRASYQAGLLAQPSGRTPGNPAGYTATDLPGQDLAELDPGADEWGGTIEG